MATGAIAVIEEDSMHPATMQAIAAQRGGDLRRAANAARQARGRQQAGLAPPTLLAQHARVASCDSKHPRAAQPFRAPQEAA